MAYRPSTSIGKALLDVADAAAARAAIGAGTSSLVIGTTDSTAKAGNYQPASTDISDSTAVGRSLITAASAAAARTAVGAPPVRSNLFYVDDYGADPTGAAFSDTALIAAYNALTAAGRGFLVFGVGTYKLNSGLNDAAGRVIGVSKGVMGQGSGQTIIDYRGPGAFVEFRNKNFDATSDRSAGGCCGLEIQGWNNTNANSYGLRYGDIWHMRIVDVQISGFRNAGCVGLYADNQYRWAERAYIDVSVSKCTQCIVFESSTGDQGFPSGSFDYSTYLLSVICDVNQDGVVIRSIAGNPSLRPLNAAGASAVEFVGAAMTIYANCIPAATGLTNTGVMFTVGVGDADASQFGGTLEIYGETSGSGTVGHKDINLGDTKYGATALVNANGAINLSGSNVFRAGTATSVRFGFTGSLRNCKSLGSAGNVQTFQSLQSLNQARGYTYLSGSSCTIYPESGNIFHLEFTSGAYSMAMNVGGLTLLGGDSPFGTTVVDIWIRQPATGSVTVNSWFSALGTKFSWDNGQVPVLTAAAGFWDVIRLTSYNFGQWVGTHVTSRRPATVAAPASASSSGIAGQLAFDSGYVYVCVSSGVWKRAALSSW